MPDSPTHERWPPIPDSPQWGPKSDQLLDDYLAIARHRGSAAAERTALRTKSFAARHLLARAATNGELPYADLIGQVHDGARLPALDPEWAIRLARVIGFQNLRADDREVAAAILTTVHRQSGLGPFTGVFQKSYAELLYATCAYDRLRRLLRKLSQLPEHTRRHLEADLLNPFGPQPLGSERRWLTSVNEIFRTAGVEPIRLLPDAPTPFDRLDAETGPAVVDGPLVTVIMTSYRPDVGIRTSVRSILDQTWQNFELIIVDDASPAQFDPVLDECLAMDDRVRLIRQHVNGGTYLARNAGLDAATGVFVTCQDSDDWSHPRRLEHQVRPLLEDEALTATRSLSLRVSGQLVFNRPGYEPSRPNASSLLFRRRQALETVGYFDSVRKGADTEYHRRLMTAAPGSCLDVGEPLAFVRMGDTSLSRTDFSFGWHHPARYAYQAAYGHWHERIAAGERSPYVHRDQSVRPVPAPARFTIGLPGRADHAQHYDVVLLSEWRRYGGPQRSMIEEIRALTTRGLRVGVAHMEAFRFMGTRVDPLCAPLQELIHAGDVDLVQLDQGADVSMLIIRYPPVLQFPPSTPTDIHVGQALILANQAPSERDGTDVRYTVPACEQTVHDLFGVEPTWVPQGPIARKALEPDVAPTRLAGFDMPGILKLDEWATTRNRFRGERPIIGRHSRDTAMKWPADAQVLWDVYPDDDEFDVRIMGGSHTVRRVTESSVVPTNWLVYDYGEIPPRLFLSQLDFFVYFHHPLWQEAFGRTILEAIATGCVAILPPHFRDLFGDAAVYCESWQVRDTVRRCYKDPEGYRAQVRRGYAFVRDTFSHDAYADTAARLLETCPPINPR